MLLKQEQEMAAPVLLLIYQAVELFTVLAAVVVHPYHLVITTMDWEVMHLQIPGPEMALLLLLAVLCQPQPQDLLIKVAAVAGVQALHLGLAVDRAL